MKQTLYDKLWDHHLVKQWKDGTALIYIDRHLLHEVTSPQAFAGLREENRLPRRPQANVATVDHAIPTTRSERSAGIVGIGDDDARLQVQTLDEYCHYFDIRQYGIQHAWQGIVHVIGPELGLTLPGMTVVCGDSHTTTHGAFSSLAHGIGTSEVEHVLATQCLVRKKMKNMQVVITGQLPKHVSAKDVVLALISQIGNAGGQGHAIEFAGNVVSELSIEGRMTLCNMAIEAGARVGLVAVDDRTVDYFHNRPFAPSGEYWHRAERYWRSLTSDTDAYFDKVYSMDVSEMEPQVSWGTSPDMVVPISGKIPDPQAQSDAGVRSAMEQALTYMDLVPGTSISDIALDRIFIGSCTNARIEDLRAAAAILKGKRIAKSLKQALVVPGSQQVKRQAEKEALDQIFIAAGMEWREPGCSMCLAMNADKLENGERCASTSNRNFEGRQGYGGRTHLVSPAMAAAAAVAGHFVDCRFIAPEVAH